MTSDWPLKTLESVAHEVTVGYVGPMATEYVESGVPFLRSLNVERFTINPRGLKYVTHEFHSRIRKSALRPGDVAIVRTGKPGTCAVIPHWLTDANCSDLVIVRCGVHLRPEFLCYWVNSKAAHHISSHTVGAVQQHFNVGAAKKMEVAVPSLQDQDEVIGILGALNDRIALLYETSATLEGIAQTLFKSWFVDFDPAYANHERRLPVGLDDATAALFADDFEQTAMGLVPEGWRVSRLADVLHAKNDRVGNLDVPEYSSTNDGLVPRSELYQKQLAVSQSKNKLVAKGDLVFGLSRQVLNFGQMEHEVGSVSSAYKVFSVNSTIAHPEMLGRLIRTRENYFFNAVSASSREGQSVSSEALAQLMFAVPPDNLQSVLMSHVNTAAAASEEYRRRGRTLEEIRDLLLPRLVSGELRISARNLWREVA